MKYPTMDWGTMEAVVNKLGGLEGTQRFLRGELIVSEPEGKEARDFTRFYADVSVGPLEKRFIPNEFFKTRKGLYLYNDMQRVLKNAQTVKSAEGEVFRAYDLVKNAYDRDIKKELPEQHEVELWQVAELIEAQKNGGNGPLLTNGYANIFYVAGYAVYVHWNADDRKWNVNDWKLGDDYWSAGDRVFSRN